VKRREPVRRGSAFGVTDPTLYERKLTNLAARFTANRPDVVGLQEMGDPAALDDLRHKLGTRYPRQLVFTQFQDHHHSIRVAALMHRGVTPVDVAELFAFPPGALVGVPQADGVLATMGRAPAFTVTLDGTAVRVMVVHLKSRLLTFPGGRLALPRLDKCAQAGAFALLRRAGEPSRHE
jgi:hypothetical protein